MVRSFCRYALAYCLRRWQKQKDSKGLRLWECKQSRDRYRYIDCVNEWRLMTKCEAINVWHGTYRLTDGTYYYYRSIDWFLPLSLPLRPWPYLSVCCVYALLSAVPAACPTLALSMSSSSHPSPPQLNIICLILRSISLKLIMSESKFQGRLFEQCQMIKTF